MVQTSFVNRNTLGVFCDSTAYFKEHWSAQLVDGVHTSQAVESILKAVPGLASLLKDVRHKLHIDSKAVRAITLAPEGMQACYHSNACIIHLGGDYARITKAKRDGSVSDAIVFHSANDGDKTETEASSAAAAA